MYLYPAKLNDQLETELRHLAASFGYSDFYMARDLFVFTVKGGKQIPDDSRIDKLARKYASGSYTSFGKDRIGLTLRRRAALFRSLSGNKMILALVQAPGTYMEKMRSLFLFMRKASMKMQLSVCATCKLQKGCKFAAKYGNVTTSITKVVDMNYRELVAPGCPALPDLDLAASAYMTQKFFETTLTQAELDKIIEEYAKQLDPNAEVTYDIGDDEEEIPIASLGDGSKLPSKRKSGFTDVEVFSGLDGLVSKLSVADLALYEFSRNLSAMLAKSYKGKYSPKMPSTQDKDMDKMQESVDVVHALPHELGSDSEVLDAKIAKKTLVVRKDVGREDKPQIFFLLLDVSGSMRAAISGGALMGQQVIMRAQVASIFAKALADHVISDKGEFVISFFDYSPSPPFRVHDKVTLKEARSLIEMNAFYGSSTNLDAALKVAEKYITDAGDKYSDAEILVITDMDTSISDEVQKLFTKKNAVRLNCLDVKPEQKDYGNARTVLKRISRNYCCLNYNELDPKKLLTVLK